MNGDSLDHDDAEAAAAAAVAVRRQRQEAAFQQLQAQEAALEGSFVAPPPTPAGWHASSDWAGQLRYWDGQRWTDAFMPAPVQAVPPAATPQRSRSTHWRWGWTVGAVLLVLILGLARWWPGRNGQIDNTVLEPRIASWAKDHGAGAVTVNCPDDINISPGREFHCIATDKSGQTIGVTVTIENQDGDVTWQAS